MEYIITLVAIIGCIFVGYRLYLYNEKNQRQKLKEQIKRLEPLYGSGDLMAELKKC